MKERQIIEKIISCFKKSNLHCNEFFESDAEVIDFNNTKILFSTDDFSAEDFFREVHPFQLGKNLATATISDILASGGIPLFYAHSMVIPSDWKEDFILDVSRGIAKIIEITKANFIGGDFGNSNEWRYTGIVIGEALTPLSRKGAKNGDAVYLTGKVGAGNLEAALFMYSEKALIGKLIKNFKTEFHCRVNESELIRNYATSCIDSSDGIFNAINTISSINKCGFYLENIPILKEASIACKIIGKPEELLILGECGEYELLFTVDKNNIEAFEKEIKSSGFEINRIGTITDVDIKKIISKNKEIKLNNFDISARAFNSTKEYLSTLTDFVNKC